MLVADPAHRASTLAPPVPAPPTKNRSGLTDGLFAPPRFMEGR
jgi:hypothetical protein